MRELSNYNYGYSMLPYFLTNENNHQTMQVYNIIMIYIPCKTSIIHS